MADYGYVVKDAKGNEIMGPFYSEELAQDATIGYPGRTVGWGRGPWLGRMPDRDVPEPEKREETYEEKFDFAQRYSANVCDQYGESLTDTYTYDIYERVERSKWIFFSETTERLIAADLTVEETRNKILQAVLRDSKYILYYSIRKNRPVIKVASRPVQKPLVKPPTSPTMVLSESDLVKDCQYRLLKRQTVKRPPSDPDFVRLGPTYSLITLYFDNLMTWHVRWFLRERSEWLTGSHITIESNEIPYGENCVIQWTNPFDGSEFHLYAHPMDTTNLAYYGSGADAYLGHHHMTRHGDRALTSEQRSRYVEADSFERKIAIARSIAQMKVGSIYLGDY